MVGFDSVAVNVAEDGGNAVLTVILTGFIQRNVVVKLLTNSDTALGKMHRGLLYLISVCSS